MKMIRIITLQDHDTLKETLLKDGWIILPTGQNNGLDAAHPQVLDEDTARLRLHNLGFLISGSLRIEFPMCEGQWRSGENC